MQKWSEASPFSIVRNTLRQASCGISAQLQILQNIVNLQSRLLFMPLYFYSLVYILAIFAISFLQPYITFIGAYIDTRVYIGIGAVYIDIGVVCASVKGQVVDNIRGGAAGVPVGQVAVALAYYYSSRVPSIIYTLINIDSISPYLFLANLIISLFYLVQSSSYAISYKD